MPAPARLSAVSASERRLRDGRFRIGDETIGKGAGWTAKLTARQPEGNQMRVLIVEDEPNLGRQLRATLEGAGYAVDLATDGEDGHYLGSTESYDAIILDLGL